VLLLQEQSAASRAEQGERAAAACPPFAELQTSSFADRCRARCHWCWVDPARCRIVCVCCYETPRPARDYMYRVS
jgi:hypothetical protein